MIQLGYGVNDPIELWSEWFNWVVERVIQFGCGVNQLGCGVSDSIGLCISEWSNWVVK